MGGTCHPGAGWQCHGRLSTWTRRPLRTHGPGVGRTGGLGHAAGLRFALRPPGSCWPRGLPVRGGGLSQGPLGASPPQGALQGRQLRRPAPAEEFGRTGRGRRGHVWCPSAQRSRPAEPPAPNACRSLATDETDSERFLEGDGVAVICAPGAQLAPWRRRWVWKLVPRGRRRVWAPDRPTRWRQSVGGRGSWHVRRPHNCSKK